MFGWVDFKGESWWGLSVLFWAHENAIFPILNLSISHSNEIATIQLFVFFSLLIFFSLFSYFSNEIAIIKIFSLLSPLFWQWDCYNLTFFFLLSLFSYFGNDIATIQIFFFISPYFSMINFNQVSWAKNWAKISAIPLLNKLQFTKYLAKRY